MTRLLSDVSFLPDVPVALTVLAPGKAHGKFWRGVGRSPTRWYFICSKRWLGSGCPPASSCSLVHVEAGAKGGSLLASSCPWLAGCAADRPVNPLLGWTRLSPPQKVQHGTSPCARARPGALGAGLCGGTRRPLLCRGRPLPRSSAEQPAQGLPLGSLNRGARSFA